jgi:undecaprenyl-diphosphatase
MSGLGDLLIALILGLVEGITEFLPVSSTGHLIVVGELLHFTGDRAATFEVVIQLGAILAVVWHYRARLLAMIAGFFQGGPDRRLALNVLLAFLPAALLGLVLIDVIKTYLFSTTVVAVALVVGGVVMLLLEWLAPRTTAEGVDQVTPVQALWIGAAQCLAMVPGTSRAAATILGGYAAGLSRPAATEFSFLLAIPTIMGAAALDLWQSRDLLVREDVAMIAVGAAVAFLSALAVIRGFLRFVARHSFTAFAWYRIAFGGVLLVLLAARVL